MLQIKVRQHLCMRLNGESLTDDTDDSKRERRETRRTETDDIALLESDRRSRNDVAGDAWHLGQRGRPERKRGEEGGGRGFGETGGDGGGGDDAGCFVALNVGEDGGVDADGD